MCTFFTILTHRGAAVRTNIVIDDDLMRRAQEASGLPTKKATVERALELLIEVARQSDIFALAGKVEMQPDYNHRALREEHGDYDPR